MLVLDAALERSRTAAAAACRRGDVVLVPTESSYALATDAFSVRGIDAIRDAKGLPGDAPLAVMVPGAATVDGLALSVSDEARALMAGFWPGGLTLLVTSQPTLAWALPGDALLAVRMPLHPVLLGLLAVTGPLVVTGFAGDPVVTVEQARERLGDAIDMALDAGALRWDEGASTVVDVSGVPARLVRPGAVPVEQLVSVVPGLVREPA